MFCHTAGSGMKHGREGGERRAPRRMRCRGHGRGRSSSSQCPKMRCPVERLLRASVCTECCAGVQLCCIQCGSSMRHRIEIHSRSSPCVRADLKGLRPTSRWWTAALSLEVACPGHPSVTEPSGLAHRKGAWSKWWRGRLNTLICSAPGKGRYRGPSSPASSQHDALEAAPARQALIDPVADMEDRIQTLAL
nr:hypothetical protein CFP56_22300 [Quercus suber]